jgi:hypothetical protein
VTVLLKVGDGFWRLARRLRCNVGTRAPATLPHSAPPSPHDEKDESWAPESYTPPEHDHQKGELWEILPCRITLRLSRDTPLVIPV